MFEFFNFAKKRRLSFSDLQTVQMVAQQVVLSLEGTVELPGATKKALAQKLTAELLEEIGIPAPDSIQGVAIEAAVKVMRELNSSPAKAAGEG